MNARQKRMKVNTTSQKHEAAPVTSHLSRFRPRLLSHSCGVLPMLPAQLAGPRVPFSGLFARRLSADYQSKPSITMKVKKSSMPASSETAIHSNSLPSDDLSKTRGEFSNGGSGPSRRSSSFRVTVAPPRQLPVEDRQIVADSTK
jgi:hypothetical protein